MLTNHEIDAFTFNEHKFTLAHRAALHGQVGVLNYLVSDGGLPVTALQWPDNSFSTPAMLAIQVRSWSYWRMSAGCNYSRVF